MDIDELLSRFQRELDYFIQTRDELQPLLERLVPALDTYFRQRDERSKGDVQVLRAAYVTYLREIDPLLRDWVAIRGSGEALVGLVDLMSEDQMVQFNNVATRELVESEGREAFDQLHANVRRQLMLFEETAL